MFRKEILRIIIIIRGFKNLRLASRKIKLHQLNRRKENTHIDIRRIHLVSKNQEFQEKTQKSHQTLNQQPQRKEKNFLARKMQHPLTVERNTLVRDNRNFLPKKKQRHSREKNKNNNQQN